MPNRQQLAFVASFLFIFSVLVALHHYIDKTLRAAGYDISRLILIGIPTQDDSTNSTAPIFPWTRSSNQTIGNMSQATFDFKDLQDKGYTQIAALFAALLSSIFIYFKFATSSECYEMALFVGVYDICDAERKPVLDPTVWQEFPLKEKIIISPNTAM